MAKVKKGKKGRKSSRKRRNPAALAVIEGGRADWNEDMRQFCAEIDPNILLADGYEKAFVGTAHHAAHGDIAVYDRDACIQLLKSRDGMSQEEAVEYFEFNTERAFAGGKTPIFLSYWPRALKAR